MPNRRTTIRLVEHKMANGSGWESNPPGAASRRLNGFEDRGGHQTNKRFPGSSFVRTTYGNRWPRPRIRFLECPARNQPVSHSRLMERPYERTARCTSSTHILCAHPLCTFAGRLSIRASATAQQTTCCDQQTEGERTRFWYGSHCGTSNIIDSVAKRTAQPWCAYFDRS